MFRNCSFSFSSHNTISFSRCMAFEISLMLKLEKSHFYFGNLKKKAPASGEGTTFLYRKLIKLGKKSVAFMLSVSSSEEENIRTKQQTRSFFLGYQSFAHSSFSKHQFYETLYVVLFFHLQIPNISTDIFI